MSKPNLEKFYKHSTDELWRDLMCHRPPRGLSDLLAKRFEGILLTTRKAPIGDTSIIQGLDGGVGDVNLDFYPVYIKKLPNGHSPESFIRFMRSHFNLFIDTKISEFSGYAASDLKHFQSNAPVGAVIHIDLRMSGRVFEILPDKVRPYLNPDDATVVVTAADGKSWTFSTAWSPDNLAHPVSGHRQFGMVPYQGGYIFYTAGADRATRYFDAMMGKIPEVVIDYNIVFNTADDLWKSLQQGVVNQVKTLGGEAEILPSISQRHDWQQAVTQFTTQPNQAHRDKYQSLKGQCESAEPVQDELPALKL